MYIAIYHPWLHTKGGAEKVVLNIAEALSRNNKVKILTGYYDKNRTYDGFKNYAVELIQPSLKVDNFLSRALSSLSHFMFGKVKNIKSYDLLIVSTGGISELITLHNYINPTIAYCHTPLRVAHQFYDYYISKSNLSKKIALWLSVKIYKILEKKSWKKMDYCICNSKNTRNNIIKYDLANEEKLMVIYPGVDLKRFKPKKNSKNYLLVTGRFKNYKNFELAIKSFKKLRIKYPNFKLIIAGSKDDKEYFKKIKKLSDKVGNINLRTNVSENELIKLYQNCFAYLFTAINEDFGITPIEAMACGKPVIAIDEGGVKETVENNKTGFLVESNADCMSNAILKLLKNKKLYKKMSRNAIKQAQKFSWKSFQKSIYKKVKDVAKN